MSKVSILLPSYNYGSYLSQAIESVLSQSYADLELIIIDDRSTDHSRDIIHKWQQADSRVVAVFHEVNRGLAGARNSGLGVSTGDFVALCDADDIWLPDKLSKQVELFCKHPEVGLVHSDSSIIDTNGIPTGLLFSQMLNTRTASLSPRPLDELCKRNFICVPTVMLRKEAIDFATGFVEQLRSLEDWVCWLKVSQRYSFRYIDEPLAQYRVHTASLSKNKQGMAANRVKAIEILLDSVRTLPEKGKGSMLYSLGMSHLELNDARSAMGAFRRSICSNPAEFRSWVRYCQSALRLACI